MEYCPATDLRRPADPIVLDPLFLHRHPGVCPPAMSLLRFLRLPAAPALVAMITVSETNSMARRQEPIQLLHSRVFFGEVVGQVPDRLRSCQASRGLWPVAGSALPGVRLRRFPRPRPNPVESFHHLGVQLHRQRAEVGLQLLDRRRSDDHGGDDQVPQQPG
jgi:hypothetical protein